MINVGGYHVRVFNTVGGDHEYHGGYLEYHGGYHDANGDIMSTVGGVQYHGGIPSFVI